jgi:hypothetical protein
MSKIGERHDSCVSQLFLVSRWGSGSQRLLKQYSMEQFMATTTVNGASFSADGKRILFSSNESGIFNVYSMPVAGGKPEALTKSTTDFTFAISYFPHDDRILYTRDDIVAAVKKNGVPVEWSFQMKATASPKRRIRLKDTAPFLKLISIWSTSRDSTTIRQRWTCISDSPPSLPFKPRCSLRAPEADSPFGYKRGQKSS